MHREKTSSSKVQDPKVAKKDAQPGSSVEDRDIIIASSAHIPDRDQSFHRGTIESAVDAQEEALTGWHRDIEQQVSGEGSESEDLDVVLDEIRPSAEGLGAQPHVNTHAVPVRSDAKAEPLKDGDLSKIQAILESRRGGLEHVVSAKETLVREQLAPSDTGSAQVDFNHPADMTEGDHDFEREISLVEIEKAELARVNLALTRLHEGTFGECESCGDDIPRQRLLAIPETELCIACQDVIEKAQGGVRTVSMANTATYTRR